MPDWRSYDEIAEAYDRVWAPRFVVIARHLVALAGPLEGLRLLDIGTGTGAVAIALGDGRVQLRSLVACDLSRPMLHRAILRVPDLRVAVGDAAALPFRTASFDRVTANCVLSHITEYHRALVEVARVLVPGGCFALSSWGPTSDAHAAAWTELLETEVGDLVAQPSLQAVAPHEGYFSSAENVRAALAAAGFRPTRTERVEVPHECSIEQYVADRELGSAGRCARQRLGEDRWRRFLAHARVALRSRFGARIEYRRHVILSVAAH